MTMTLWKKSLPREVPFQFSAEKLTVFGHNTLSHLCKQGKAKGEDLHPKTKHLLITCVAHQTASKKTGQHNHQPRTHQ